MRTYQIHPTAYAECCLLMPTCTAPAVRERAASSVCSAVPCSPGRARRLYPYPSSRRHRRQ